MFSLAFILGFLDFVVSILFLSPFRLHNIYWISAHYKQSVRFQEENHEALKKFKEIAASYYPDFATRAYPKGHFDETNMDTVPLSLYIITLSSSLEDAVRLAISHGGDSDTIGAIVGSIAEARNHHTAISSTQQVSRHDEGSIRPPLIVAYRPLSFPVKCGWIYVAEHLILLPSLGVKLRFMFVADGTSSRPTAYCFLKVGNAPLSS